MSVILLPEPGHADVLAVAEHMRERDREEIYATQWTGTPNELTAAVLGSGAYRWGAYLDGRPVAMIGAVPRWPNVWTAWAFGTDEWNRVVLSLTRHVRRFMIPGLFNAGALRVDSYAMLAHEDARKWLASLGARPGNPLDNWGRNGETFVCYSWLRQDIAASATAVRQPKG